MDAVGQAPGASPEGPRRPPVEAAPPRGAECRLHVARRASPGPRDPVPPRPANPDVAPLAADARAHVTLGTPRGDGHGSAAAGRPSAREDVA